MPTDDDSDLLHGLTAEYLSRISGTHVTTCRRWARTRRLPPVARELIRVMRGDLGLIHPAWKGWTLTERGELVSPENWSFQQQLCVAKQLDFVEGRCVAPDEHRMVDARDADLSASDSSGIATSTQA